MDGRIKPECNKEQRLKEAEEGNGGKKTYQSTRTK